MQFLLKKNVNFLAAAGGGGGKNNNNINNDNDYIKNKLYLR